MTPKFTAPARDGPRARRRAEARAASATVRIRSSSLMPGQTEERPPSRKGSGSPTGGRTSALAFAVLFGLALASGAAAPPPQGPLPLLGQTAPPTPYHPDPEHPWNRLHAILFRQELRTGAAACLLQGSCGEVAPERMLDELVRVRFEEGGDGSTLLLRGDVTVLAEPARLAALEGALDAALAKRRHATTEAALLLQHDVWERFDAVHTAHERAEPGDRAALARLRQRLGEAVRDLARPAAEIRGVRPNLEQVAGAYPELADLDRASAWLEVTARHRTGPGEESILPLHASNAGFRSSFRTLLRQSDDADERRALRATFLGSPSHVELPAGTRVALLESPLAVDSRGELVAVPLVTLVETRRVGPRAPPRRLRELDFGVLELHRAWLTATPRRSGGLTRVGADAPVPGGASCLKERGLVLPLRGACFRCHFAGVHLPGLRRHAHTTLALGAPDALRQAAATIEAKLGDESFAALRHRFETP